MDGSIPPRRCHLPYGRVSSRFASAAVIAMTGFCLALTNPSAGQPPGTLPGSVGKGPVDWDSYRRLDLLPALRSGTETRDFDSTDPGKLMRISIIRCGLRSMASTSSPKRMGPAR
ncbi:MAG TPA: hypothetical protein VK673_05595 [Chthoniobacterales bacterium]|nr:hypothetical protein [Chthoniobacterales bacterium]